METGNKANQRISGFTLLEIMIAVVIIGVMAAVVSLNVGTAGYSEFKSSANKIASLFEIIADEAVFTNSLVSCYVDDEANSPTNGVVLCNAYKNGEWDSFNYKNLVPWGWPEHFKITQILIDGEIIKTSDKFKFFPNGDNSPISIQVSDGVYKAWIDGDIHGKFTYHN